MKRSFNVEYEWHCATFEGEMPEPLAAAMEESAIAQVRAAIGRGKHEGELHDRVEVSVPGVEMPEGGFICTGTFKVSGLEARGDRTAKVCPDCKVLPGQRHTKGCDIERCPECGLQRISCRCHSRLPHTIWTGENPGDADCRELGFYCKLTGNGWTPCSKDDPDATFDLNRLYAETVWDRKKGRFVPQKDVAEPSE